MHPRLQGRADGGIMKLSYALPEYCVGCLAFPGCIVAREIVCVCAHLLCTLPDHSAHGLVNGPVFNQYFRACPCLSELPQGKQECKQIVNIPGIMQFRPKRLQRVFSYLRWLI